MLTYYYYTNSIFDWNILLELEYEIKLIISV